jgi:hypothetical protein
MICIISLIVLALGAGEDGAGAEPEDKVRLTRPSLVALDFRDQPVPDVVKAIRERTGNALELLSGDSPHWREQWITLEVPETVPFWEALDRLCAVTHLQRNVSGGLLGSPRAHIQLHGPQSTGDSGPARYVGPLRLGDFALHARHDLVYVPAPIPVLANDSGSFYAEFKVQAEPRFVAYRTGPLAGLEVVDEKGQSLLDPKIAERGPPLPPFGYNLGWVRISLARPPQPSTTLKRLRGVMPIEIVVRPAEPTLIIPLAGSAGKTFRAGDVAFTIAQSEVDRQGTTRLRLTVRLEGERNDPAKISPGLLHARAMGLSSHLIEIVDDEGKSPISLARGPDVQRNELTLRYTISPYPPGPKAHPPTQLRYYALIGTTWEVPFESSDLPLP